MAKLGTEGVPSGFRGAAWIWADNPWWDLYNCYALFRKTFALGSAPRKAMALVTADQSYRLFVNGTYVTRGPARGFQSHWPYDEMDLAPWLRAGENVIATRAYNPGLMQIIGGIRQTAAGGKKVSFAPEFIGEEAAVSVPTPLGTIASAWKRAGTTVAVNLALPRGVTAIARLPGRKPERVEGTTQWKIELA